MSDKLVPEVRTEFRTLSKSYTGRGSEDNSTLATMQSKIDALEKIFTPLVARMGNSCLICLGKYDRGGSDDPLPGDVAGATWHLLHATLVGTQTIHSQFLASGKSQEKRRTVIS